MSETQEQEMLLAFAWFECKYDEKQARLSAEIQGLDFNIVERYYGELYHTAEAASNGYS